MSQSIAEKLGRLLGVSVGEIWAWKPVVGLRLLEPAKADARRPGG